MKSTGRTLTAGFLVLTGTGFLMLSGAGIARAEPVGAAAAPAVCNALDAAQKSFTATLDAHPATYYQSHDSVLVAAVDNFGSQVLKVTAQGSSALQSAAKTYVTYDETATAARDVNAARLDADFDRLLVLACTPNGAPATGGGSSAGLQDPALFGASGATALAGFVVVGLALRHRSRTSAEHG